MADTLHSAEADIPTITRDELVRRAADPRLILVDVLPPVSFERRRIPGSRNLPCADLEALAHQILPDRQAEIVVYCGGFT